MKEGTYDVTWQGTDNAGSSMSSGIYLARLTTGNFMKSIRINYSK